MCDDCLSMAAEYEFLHEKRKIALMNAQRVVEELTREVERWKSRAEAFEHVAKIGFSEIMLGYIDSLMEKARQGAKG